MYAYFIKNRKVKESKNMKNYTSLYAVLWIIFTIISPSLGMEHQMTWSNTPQEQIMYLNAKNWNLPTKTYVLQLLWWNTRQALKIVPKNAPDKINIDNHNKTVIKHMSEFGHALRDMNQSLPVITHEKDKQPHPKYTFELTKIPKDATPELKKLLLNSLSKEQKQMLNARKIIETNLSRHDKELKQKEKLSEKDYLQHKALLEEYYKILLPQDEELKEKITNAIATISDKLSRHKELQQLFADQAKKISSKVLKDMERDEQQRWEQEIEKDINEGMKNAEEQQNEARREFRAKQTTQEREQEKLAQERLEYLRTQKELELERLEQEKLIKRQRIIDAQWIPWITNKFIVPLRQQMNNFFSSITSTLASWWSRLTGR